MLAGHCGEPCCSNALRQPTGRAFRLDAGRQRIARDGDALFCRSGSSASRLPGLLAPMHGVAGAPRSYRRA